MLWLRESQWWPPWEGCTRTSSAKNVKSFLEWIVFCRRVENGRLVNDPDEPLNPHFCQPRPYLEVVTKRIWRRIHKLCAAKMSVFVFSLRSLTLSAEMFYPLIAVKMRAKTSPCKILWLRSKRKLRNDTMNSRRSPTPLERQSWRRFLIQRLFGMLHVRWLAY